MGDLIAFARRNSETKRSTGIVPGGAEIVFFTGVRYERQEISIDELASKPARAVRRGPGKPTNPGKRRA